jgi:hypothetical protein
LRTIRLALVAAGLCVAQGAPASAACVVLAGTADGFDKETAVSRAQLALDDYLKQYKADNHLRRGDSQGHTRRTAALLARQSEREHDVPPRHRD